MSNKEANGSNIALSQLRVMQDAERGYAKLGLEEPTSDTLPLRHLRTDSTYSQHTANHAHEHDELPQHHQQQVVDSKNVFWDRFRGKGRRVPGFVESLKNIALSSGKSLSVVSNVQSNATFAGINILFIFLPFAWASHFAVWEHVLTFSRTCRMS